MTALPGLRDIATRYAALVVDVWGVLTNGDEAFTGAVTALVQARSAGLRVVLASNTSRDAANLRCLLRRLGIVDEAYDELVTSGELARKELAGPAYAGARRYVHLGSRQNTEWLAASGASEAPDVAAADLLVATGTLDAPGDESAAARILAAGLRRGLPLLCANPDRAVALADGRRVAVGVLADRYEAAGGPVRRFGKPEPALYRRCAVSRGVRADRVLAIGDAFATDIVGGHRMGFATALIMAGIHQAELSGPDGPAALTALSERYGVAPTHVLESLRW
jgi:HAD superfamily hydrolase (TIGR01459 family)